MQRGLQCSSCPINLNVIYSCNFLALYLQGELSCNLNRLRAREGCSCHCEHCAQLQLPYSNIISPHTLVDELKNQYWTLLSSHPWCFYRGWRGQCVHFSVLRWTSVITQTAPQYSQLQVLQFDSSLPNCSSSGALRFLKTNIQLASKCITRWTR